MALTSNHSGWIMEKKVLLDLYKEHNSVVKDNYKVEDINTFKDYLFQKSEYDETLTLGVNYVEIDTNETINGNPHLLQWD